MSERIEQQNAVIIALLARSVFTVEVIANIVTRGKKRGTPENFIQAYNALDGSTTAVTLAKIVGITQQAMGSVLQTWEDAGIVYKTGGGSHSRYYGLLKIPRNLPKEASAKAPKRSARPKSRKQRIKQPLLLESGQHVIEDGSGELVVDDELAPSARDDSAAADQVEVNNGG